MRLSLGISTGDRILSLAADALGFDTEIDSSHLDVCRAFAFSSDTAEEFSSWYLRSECFSKFRSGGVDLKRSTLTQQKFLDAEYACELANARLVDTWSRASLNQSVWRRARSLVADVLGQFPWDSFPRYCGFGPGASVGLPSRKAFHQNKWELSTHITEGALPYFSAFDRWAGLDGLSRNLTVVPGNKVTTVPKSYKIDRTIAIEPDWNMFFQKGVGGLIRRRLQRVGLLHPDAQEKNRALARLGSWTGSLATLDMSAASDSVSLALCEALLPESWFRVILDLRSPAGQYEGQEEWITYSKVSSMGNGFTFELETLLFWALSLAACGKANHDRVSVYGDDIVVPTHHASLVISVLNEAGFSINVDKTFVDGPFRESCGGHYWRGRDVTPFYIRGPMDSVNDLIVTGNHIVRWCANQGHTFIGPWWKCYRAIRHNVPRPLWGPYGHDGVLWANWDQCRPFWHRDFQSYRQRVIRRETKDVDFGERHGGLLHALWTSTADHEASWGLLPRERWGTSKTYVDRDQWQMLPVRIA